MRTMPVFYFPATAALLLRTRTYMSETAIANAIRNYGQSGEPFWIKSVRPGNDHYRVTPARNGFYITAGPLSALR